MRLRPRHLLLGAAGCVAGFVAVLVAAYAIGPVRWADASALEGFMGLQGTVAEPLADGFANLADPLPYALFGLALVAVALARGRPGHALVVGVMLVGTGVTSQVLKPLLAEPRFHGFLGPDQIDPAAFPSGHATAAMTLALAAVIVAPRRLRPLVAAGGGVFTLAVSFSILVLGWHFPSDVVGGFLVATAWCLALLAGLRATTAAGLRPERAARGRAGLRATGAAGVRRGERTARGRAGAGSAGLRSAAVASVALAAALVAAVALLGELSHVVSYADRHTSATAATVGIMAAAAALLAAVTVAAQRR